MKRVPISITKGSTYTQAFYWYDGPTLVYPIVNITNAYPPVCTTMDPHGLPSHLTPARLVGIRGPSDLNTDPDDPNAKTMVLKLTANEFEVPDFNAEPLPDYGGGGYLTYVAPKNLTGHKARMQFRKSVTSTTVLVDMSSDTGEIVITPAEGLTTLTLTAAATAAFDFKAAVYDLEIVLPGVTPADDIVIKTFYGPVTIGAEVTR